MRSALERFYPDKSAGTLGNWAGTLRRFAFEAQPGDLIIFPNKQDRTLNFGVLTGDYYFDSDAHRQKHRRKVSWLENRTAVARSLFSQKALNELGSLMTMFAVRNNAAEFWDFLNSSEASFVEKPKAIQEDTLDGEASAAPHPTADQVDQSTRDYIADVLLNQLTHEEFEYFTADLLRCMGYQARVTQYSSDGGVDVIAHRDLLGLEPPVIKVQCKHTASTQGRPEVQQLIGTLDTSEAGLFFTLGSYSREALALEREKQRIRLFSGNDITDLTLRYYDNLPEQWRSRMPLRRVFAIDSE